MGHFGRSGRRRTAGFKASTSTDSGPLVDPQTIQIDDHIIVTGPTRAIGAPALGTDLIGVTVCVHLTRREDTAFGLARQTNRTIRVHGAFNTALLNTA